MSSKDRNTQIFIEKVKDENFKIKLKPGKMVFPISTWDLDNEHLMYISIEHAVNIGKITKQQGQGFRNNLKEKMRKGERVWIDSNKVEPVYSTTNYYCNLGNMQQFFSAQNVEEGWGCKPALFETKELLINSFKMALHNCDDVRACIDSFFKYMPHLKGILSSYGYIDESGYCCDDCDGSYSSYVQGRREHESSMAVLTLEKKVTD